MNWKLTLGTCLSFLLISSSAFAQGRITGSVKDASGAVLPGAVVSVEGLSITAMSDNNGMYVVNVTSNTVSVTASAMGHSAATKGATLRDGAAVINFTLNSEAIALDDIVVIGLWYVKYERPHRFYCECEG